MARQVFSCYYFSYQAFATEPEATDELLNDVVGVFVVAFDTRHGKDSILVNSKELDKFSHNYSNDD